MAFRRLLLIDGSAVIYRGFFAIRNLRTASGEPTNAVFGFIRMTRQLSAKWSPTHLAVVADGGLPAWRMELQKDYKANRPETPQELRLQRPIVEKYLEAARITRIRVDGEEADDVIASVAEKVRPAVDEVLVATGDKDMFQLVDDNLKIIPVAGKDDILDVQGVKRKTGVSPGLIPDWLALVGDSSDNIPGVMGIGPKTAARILNTYGSLTDIFDSGESVGEKDKTIAKILSKKDLVMRNLEMVTLKRDIECPFTFDDMQARDPGFIELGDFYRRWEFDAFLKELEQGELL